MIELKHVNKTYISKKAANTKALDDVSFTLPDQGLVFILGKSGCGKSTLLNLIGGLDTVTSGNIIVNNKDITKLKDKEYDAYRNSIIGIVFQEFNLLDEYTVYENIALAKELQEKATSEDEISDLLDKLGLKGLEKRKINELSGGQKQRVAIARALIKSPSILLCDEPTGNLDSKSSKQIFEILKEISAHILVVVVSHDVEAAKTYGDNIIELQDGKVISNNIGKITKKKDELKLINSKLPFKYLGKLAKRSMLAKPIKLFMTVLITSIAVLFMGVGMNVTLFDQRQLIYETMVNNDAYTFTIEGYKWKNDIESLRDLTDEDMQRIKNAVGENKINYVYNLYADGDRYPVTFDFDDESYYEEIEISDGLVDSDYYNYYFVNEISDISFVELVDDALVGDVIGAIPRNASEILIHKYMAEYIIRFGIYDKDGVLYQPKSIEELIASKTLIKIGNYEVYISGVIDDDNSEYQEAYEIGKFNDNKTFRRFEELYVRPSDNVYVKGFVDQYMGSENQEDVVNSMYLSYSYEDLSKVNLIKEDTLVLTKDGKVNISSLAKDEVILSYSMLRRREYKFQEELDAYAQEYRDLTYAQIEENFTIKYLQEHEVSTTIYLANQGIPGKVVGVSLDDKSYVSYDYTEDFQRKDKKQISFLIYESDKNKLKKIIREFDVYEWHAKDGEYLVFVPPYNSDIEGVSEAHYYIGYIALAVTMVFTMFTIFVFTNFISVSITYSRKKIGILKALGASSKDVLKIFAYESGMIAVISWFIGVILVFIASYIINYAFQDYFPIEMNVIVNHPLTPVIMFLHTIIISLFITAIAISYVSRVKPIDSILEK